MTWLFLGECWKCQALASHADFCFIRVTSQPVEEFKIAWPV
jgi:hypothetical protein